MMRRALFHAARAMGATAPNPLVGAVVVDGEGVVVGQGFHAGAGRPHAEVVALDEAGPKARGGTLYVTLEPCCHVGRTGPCTTRIVEAGVARVVAATLDPYPQVAGRGVRLLAESGIHVDVGLEEAEARRLNAAYLMALEARRPLVIVKAATTRDGRIAATRDQATAISGPAARRRSQRLRASVDAIAVGAGTVAADDPELTVRDLVRDRPLTRVVFDRSARITAGRRVLADDDAAVVVVTAPAHVASVASRLAQPGRRAVDVVGAASLGEALTALVPRGVHSLLVEGGAGVHRSFFDARMVDRLHLIVAPTRLGADAVPLFDGVPVPWAQLSRLRAEPCGDDYWMEADVHWNH